MAFLWDGGDYETIDVPGASATAVYGINNRGRMVGSYRDTAGASHGFLRDRDGSVSHARRRSRLRGGPGRHGALDINEYGQIVGASAMGRAARAASCYERGTLPDDRRAPRRPSRAIDINNRGQVVGDYGTRP